jgi:hypothetical protein
VKADVSYIPKHHTMKTYAGPGGEASRILDLVQDESGQCHAPDNVVASELDSKIEDHMVSSTHICPRL